MTYRELIEYCYNAGRNACENCKYGKECDDFLKIDGYVPAFYGRFVKLDLDKEIDVS